MLRDDLAINVFTYNRASSLRQTLEQLADSPFAECAITVLDNHSTDETPAVCEELASRFERYRVVRHRVNIGLGPNYLRALELSETKYSWVLSDDESFDFSDVQDVIDVIEEGEVDLISLGSPGQQQWERGLRTTTRELHDRGQRYFYVFTFVAGVIFRTEQFDSTCVSIGYRNSDNFYPQLEHIHQCLVHDRPVYVSRAWIAERNPRPLVETVGSSLYWFMRWVRSNRFIEEKPWRDRANWDSAHSRGAWVKSLAVSIALERLDHPERLNRELTETFLGLNAEQRAILVALLPLAFVPRSVYARVRRINEKRRGVPPSDPTQAEYDVLRL